MTAVARWFTPLITPKFWPDWMQWLWRDLAPFPGRSITTMRMVVSVLIVTITSQTLQVPYLFFSAFFVVFVTKENRALTTLTGIIFMAGATLAVASSIFVSSFVFDYPQWRVPALACFVFVGMFLSRTFFIGPLGFIFGFFVSLTQILTEAAPNPESLVRSLLWIWVAIVYPIAVTVVINQILLPAHPWNLLVGALRMRLDAAAAALQRTLDSGHAGGRDNPALLDLATRGGTAFAVIMKFVEAHHPELKHRHNSILATVAAADHVVRATAALEFREKVTLSPKDIECVHLLLGEIAELRDAAAEREPRLIHRDAPPARAELPQLRDLQFALESFRDGLIRESSLEATPAAPPAKKRIFVADAFTNPFYLKFSLKVTLAAMTCYLIYTGLDWPGISTSFVTCCFIALENTGATLWKGWLRLGGCLVGATLGYLAIFLYLPFVDSITALVLLAAFGTAITGWVSAGSDRISYGGVQGALAFYFCIFQGYEPGFSFSLARDRVAGIILGILVFSVVLRLIWPEHAIDVLRSAMARVMRGLAKFLLLPKAGSSTEDICKEAAAQRLVITRDLDSTLRLSELAVIEDAIIKNRDAISPVILERMAANTQSLSLISFILAGKTKMEEWQHLDPKVQEAEIALRARAAEELEQIARFVESCKPGIVPGIHPAYTAWNELAATVSDNDRPRLVRRMMAQVRELHANEALANTT